MNLLLTGATGFIGRNMHEKLQGYTVFAPGSLELNLLDRDSLVAYIKNNRIDVIVDCTCWNSYTNSSKTKDMVFVNNVKMFFNISSCSSLVKKIIYFGSGAEFDRDNWKSMMDESYFSLSIPKDDYGLSKYVNFLQARQFQNIYNLRIFGVFGPYEDNKRFISYCIIKVLRKEVIEIHQNRIFDYLYVDDLITITGQFIKKDFKYRAYNVCTGKGQDLIKLANKVIQIAGNKVSVKVLKPGLNREYTGDNTLLLKEIKMQFENINNSIEKLVQYYKTANIRV